ncbi:hypothetical protein D3C72_2027850 [compost metagenome]
MSSIASFRFKAFATRRLERTTSVLPAAASSRSMSPPPCVASAKPLSPSTNAAAWKPSIFVNESSDILAIFIFSL